MNQSMASGIVRLKARELLEAKSISMYRAAKDGAGSYPTVHKYVTSPEEVSQISGEFLYGLLVDVLKMSPAEIAEMRLGDVFQLEAYSDAGQ